MTVKLKNNVVGYLASQISTTDTSLALASGNGANFPALGVNEYFYATLVSAGGTIEIVKATARVGDALTVVRAQEGTTAAGFAVGARVELRVTAQSVLDAVADALAGATTITPYSEVFTATAGQTVFSLSANPGSLNNLSVSMNGSTLVNGVDFTWTGTTLTLTVAALAGQVLQVQYGTSSSVAAIPLQSVTDASIATGSTLYNLISQGPIEPYVNIVTATAGQTAFSLSYNPGSLNNLHVTLNGSKLQNGVDFTWASTTVTLATGAAAGDVFMAQYTRSTSVSSVPSGSVLDVSVATGSKLYNRINDWVSVKDFGAVGDGVADDTAAIQAAINASVAAGGSQVFFPEGHYKTTDTVTILNAASLMLIGSGERTTQITFVNATSGKVMFDIDESSSNVTFSDMHLTESAANYGTSIAVRMADNLPDIDGRAQYKNSMVRCRVYGFLVGVQVTTASPTTGATHAFCSENLFLHTRFRNCRTTFLMENIQAVDLTLVATDIENDDAGESYTMFKDMVGGDYKVFGGSFVGKGIVLDCYQPVGSTSLWQAAKFSMKDSRFECRATHTGTLFKPVASSFATDGYIQIDGCSFLMFTQNLTLVDFGGKTNVVVKNSKCYAGTLAVKESPTTGITATFNSGDGYYESFGSVVLRDTYGFNYVKQTSSSYGTYDERYTAPVTVENELTNPTAGSYTIDAYGFLTHNSQKYSQRGVGLSYAYSNKLVYNIDRPLSSFTNVKLKLPFGATPMKLLMFKHPNIRSTDVNYKLYAVKDVANWATPGTFAVGTDAIELANTTTTANRAGYLEIAVNLSNSYFDAGTQFQSGKGTWTEGRVYLELTSGGSMNGFVGVEYI